MTQPVNSQSRPILVAVDFSPFASAAMEWAAQAARAFCAPLLVLHVIHDPAGTPGAYATEDDSEGIHRLEDVAQAKLNEFVRDFRALHPDLLPDAASFVDRLVSGLPATRILEVADEVDARLIVVGSQGRSGLGKFLLGSKAEKVVQLAQRPVTVVKISDDGECESGEG